VEELRRLRVQKGYSQRQLAARATIDQAAISQIEGGKRNPSVAVLERLAVALDIGVAELFPKVQAPLFEEESEQRRSPFVDALTSYLLRLAQEWEETLPDSEELRANPWLAFGVLGQSELVQAELSMLEKTIFKAITDAPSVKPSAADLARWREERLSSPEWDAMFFAGPAVPKDLAVSFFRVHDAAIRWLFAARDALDVARNVTESHPWLARAEQGIERAAKKRRESEALVEGRRSA